MVIHRGGYRFEAQPRGKPQVTMHPGRKSSGKDGNVRLEQGRSMEAAEPWTEHPTSGVVWSWWGMSGCQQSQSRYPPMRRLYMNQFTDHVAPKLYSL
jgi:hypothetical protein